LCWSYGSWTHHLAPCGWVLGLISAPASWQIDRVPTAVSALGSPAVHSTSVDGRDLVVVIHRPNLIDFILIKLIYKYILDPDYRLTWRSSSSFLARVFSSSIRRCSTYRLRSSRDMRPFSLRSASWESSSTSLYAYNRTVRSSSRLFITHSRRAYFAPRVSSSYSNSCDFSCTPSFSMDMMSSSRFISSRIWMDSLNWSSILFTNSWFYLQMF
jgi:hypothetical protein